MKANSSKLHATDFSQVWRQSFGDTPPLGHILRHDFFGHWTRFHALPDSKRYADTKEESAIVLSRANTLATECFGNQARVWAVTGYAADPSPKDDELPELMSMTRVMTWVEDCDEPEDQCEIAFFAQACEWKPNSLDKLFDKIANDLARAVLFSEDTQTVLAPYDGGFDVFSLQPDRIGYLEAKYRAWMSSRPDKL